MKEKINKIDDKLNRIEEKIEKSSANKLNKSYPDGYECRQVVTIFIFNNLIINMIVFNMIIRCLKEKI
jgi:hypothetical protein